MKKIAQVILCLSFAMAANLLCTNISSAQAVAGTDTSVITTSDSDEKNKKTIIEDLTYEEAGALTEVPVISEDKIYYTEQN